MRSVQSSFDRALWRHPHLWGAIVVIAASMLAFGPDGWMEWLFWAASVETLLIARVALACIAAAVVVVIGWPLISGRRG